MYCTHISIGEDGHGMCRYTMDQVKQAIRSGALLEIIPNAKLLKSQAQLIKTVGAEHFILTTDAGQAERDLPCELYRNSIQLLMDNGLTEREIKLIAQKNPAKLLAGYLE